ncbi:hypothetical protein [Sporocytophaga myxococcoides]|uniref:hypothetical protein n=1 Tax=Sporocytophaga myxococcoides TaxID=153721 RepID=UPI000405491F|nr:hypothetical protein [Sporocytophaga myxococcoides]
MKNESEFMKCTYSGLKKYICKTLFLTGVCLYTLSSCSESGASKREKLMALHDSEMEKMDKIVTLKEELKQLNNSTINEDNKKEISLQIKRLEEADEAMMGWMRNYKEPSESIDKSVKEKYYNDQIVVITNVKEVIENSLDSGQIILNKYKH